MWLVTTWITAALAAAPGAPPPAVAALSGTWLVDWSSSTGVEDLLAAQGVPGFMRAIATRVRIRQEIAWADGRLQLRRHLPIGSVTEHLAVDGSWQELDSRLGDHRARVVIGEGGLVMERRFEDYTLTEAWSLDGTSLVSHRTLVHEDGRTLESVLRMDRLASE